MKLLFFAIMLWGCTPEYIPEPFDPSDWIGAKCDTTLHLVWQKPIFEDTSEVIINLYLRNGKLIYQLSPANENLASEVGFLKIENNNFQFLNSLKSNLELRNFVFYQYSNSFVVHNDILSYSDGSSLYGINENAEIIWKFRPDGTEKEGYGNPFISNYKDLVLFPSNNQDTNYSDSTGYKCYMFGVNIQDGTRKVLFVENPKKYMNAHIDQPVTFTHNGDLIMVFQNRNYDFFHLAKQTDLISWNITQNKQLWRLDSLDKTGHGSANDILYEDGRIYYASADEVRCINPLTGEQLWKQSFKNFEYGFQTNNLLLTQDGLIVKSAGNGICLLNKNNGEFIWENRSVGTTPKQLMFYKGDVFFNCGDGKLYCVNVKSGLLKFKATSPNECRDDRAHYGIVQFIINPENNLLYIGDDFFIQCFQLKGYD